MAFPFASSTTAAVPWVDALFTATSAVCVTGLTTIDVGSRLSGAGQVILLLLIQLGGLGILTLSLLFVASLGVKVSFAVKLSVESLTPSLARRRMLMALAFVVSVTLLIEAVGAVFLFFFMRRIPEAEATVFQAVFHAVSAFCNAGFSLYPDNLFRFRESWPVLLVIMGLIIAGGFGFVPLDEMGRFIFLRKSGPKQLTLQTKVALAGTLLLIGAGTVVFLILEAGSGFRELPGHAKVLNSLFLAVTPRTAGFNVVDTGSLTDATLFVVLALMFIGGCPGSTAGGVKVHTFFTVLAMLRAQLMSLRAPSLFSRKIPEVVLGKAITIFVSSFVAVNAGVFLLLLTEGLSRPHREMSSEFLDIFFEAVSAMGTVGLSTGITPQLSSGGKIVLCVLMFIGRVGPLTAGLTVWEGFKKARRFEFVEENMMLG